MNFKLWIKCVSWSFLNQQTKTFCYLRTQLSSDLFRTQNLSPNGLYHKNFINLFLSSTSFIIFLLVLIDFRGYSFMIFHFYGQLCSPMMFDWNMQTRASEVWSLNIIGNWRQSCCARCSATQSSLLYMFSLSLLTIKKETREMERKVWSSAVYMMSNTM